MAVVSDTWAAHQARRQLAHRRVAAILEQSAGCHERAAATMDALGSSSAADKEIAFAAKCPERAAEHRRIANDYAELGVDDRVAGA